ncbi:MAG TPA: hypothetical protein VGC66_21245 [Pyrinomonadaceae bacterium]
MLILILACSTFAGEIPYPGVTAPPPPAPINGEVQYPGATSPSATASGDMPFPGVTESTLTETALHLLQGVLSLF